MHTYFKIILFKKNIYIIYSHDIPTDELKFFFWPWDKGVFHRPNHINII